VKGDRQSIADRGWIDGLARAGRKVSLTKGIISRKPTAASCSTHEVAYFSCGEIDEKAVLSFGPRQPNALDLTSKGPGGGLKSEEMEHREAHHLEGMNVSAVQNIQVEGRHSDQSCRHTAEHCFSISPVRLERLNASGDLSYR
jgi:hypothetical protein